MAELKLFDFLDSTGFSKRDLIRSAEDPDAAERVFVPWMINLGFSQHVDTILYANDVNKMAGLPNRMQHDYYLHSLRKGKRFGSWAKAGKDETLDAIQWRYLINRKRAVEYLKTMKPEDAEAITRDYKNASGEQPRHLQRVRG